METREQRSLVPRKLVEAGFRNLWILLLPILIVPVAVTFLTREETVYNSGATIWTQQTEGVDSGPLATSTNPYITPAENQVKILYDLLATQTFRTDIALTAKLVTATSSQDELTDASDYVGKSISVAAIGTNLIGLRVATPIAADSFDIANAFVIEFQERALAESVRLAQVKIDYYDEQLSLASAELDERRNDLNIYVAANPKVVDPNLKLYDAQYESLKASVDTQTILVQGLTSKRFDAELSVKSAETSQAATFNVQDAPRLATAPQSAGMMKRFGLPLAGMLFGAFISAAYLYLVYRLDQTIRTASDLSDAGVTLLGYVPEIQKGPGAGLWQYTPFGWLMKQRQRGYARKVAASIASIQLHEGRG